MWTNKEAWSAKDVEYVLLLAQGIQSLNEPIKSEDGDIGAEYGDLIEDTINPRPEDIVIAKERCNTIMKYMNKYLKPREKEILCLRYGFVTGNPMTLNEVGEHYGLSRERVRQIEDKAIRRLRYRFRNNNIREEDI